MLTKQATPGATPLVQPRITLLPLIAATYFMVCGGPYGLEDLVHDTGYLAAVGVLLVTPVLWSLPTALMVGELSAALPQEGGYYAWVRRALGPFWGFQEAWLSLAASVFDMAIYPTLFVFYLAHLVGALSGTPVAWAEGHAGWGIGAGMIAACAVANVLGVRVVGGSSVALAIPVLGPFVVLVGIALIHRSAAGTPPSAASPDLVAGVLVAMWNYMGWDNASTIAGEVERPARTYPLVMLWTLGLAVLTYALPVFAASRTGIDPADWAEGSWVQVADAVAGRALAVAVAVGMMIGQFGAFNALVLSYSRVPAVLAEDGYLPAVLGRRHPRTGAPWVSVLVCAAAWALALRLGFRRLVAFDVLLYGLSLILEFVALVALRLREPDLPRPFRTPGGLIGAWLLGGGPTVLLAAALYHERHEQIGPLCFQFLGTFQIGPVQAVVLGAILAGLGPVVYLAGRWLGHSGTKRVDSRQ